ncbi:MAG: BMC domain-containing protein, partial [Planctomycetota bacterium]
KQAAVRILVSRSVHPGKYTTLWTGTVEDVSESLKAAVRLEKTSLVDLLFLPYVHDKVIQALSRLYNPNIKLEALGVLEATSVASLIKAADIAVKCALVHFISMRLADHLGGKSFFTLTGEMGDLQSAMEMAVAYTVERKTFLHKVIIPNPHPEMGAVLQGKTV